jgi:hypothetical protein
VADFDNNRFQSKNQEYATPLICWMNPPYKDVKKWIIKAYNESIKHNSYKKR